MSHWPLRLAALALASLLTACSSLAPRPPTLDTLLQTRSSAGPLAFASGEVLTDNDAAFAAKLQAVDEARQELDLAYYIFSDDHSSARLSQALIDAAQRGVRVRLLVDYHSAYKDLDRFDWLERQGGGRIEVRLYNRPTVEILKDAAFLTLGCEAVGVAGRACDAQKIAAIDAQFAPGAPGAPALLDRNVAGSGAFLSGLYGKNAKLMAYAITQGQVIDASALKAEAAAGDADRSERMKALGKLYFRARYLGGVEGLEARIRLAVVRLAFAEQVNPVFDAINSALPITRQKAPEAQQDWDYLTEFLHHKILLADRRLVITGGRNVEDSYHLNPSPLASKYIFMDTDLRLRLAAPSDELAGSFERLWTLRTMVASLADVRRHAPNDLLENFPALTAALEGCQEGRDRACVDREVEQRFQALPQRLQAVAARHREHLQRFAAVYRPRPASGPLVVDPGAQIHYLENLPVANGRRVYGARHDREAASNKNIQALWRGALAAVCAADGPAPREVVYHNAYLFLPANLLQDLGRALDGSQRCAGVRLTLLSNSLATTDLNIVNLLATWQLKALADHLKERGPRTNAASLRYAEYLPSAEGKLSLHSKVMLFDRDVFIGSANADVRSLMMDSNNGMWIRRAPGLAEAMHRQLRELLASPRVADQTAAMGREAAALSLEMNRLVDQLLARYAGPDRLDDAQRSDLKQRVQATSQRVYDLSRGILRGDAQAADEFNALFKAI